MIWYVVLVLAVGVERLAELVVVQAERGLEQGARRSRARRGPLPGHGGAAHRAAGGLPARGVAAAHRDFHPWLGWPALAVVVASQGLRWWCIRTLGSRWNTRVIVVPGLPLVSAGPYRLMRHPNYVAVVAEGLALPLVHTAVITAASFLVLNAALLRVRIRAENSALAAAPAATA